LATALHVFLGLDLRFKQQYQDHWAIYQARIDAERRLAVAARDAGHDDEYEIVNVMKYWLEAILVESFSECLSEQLADYELTVESQRSFKDPDIEDFLKQYSAETTIFLSDFYMTSSMLMRLLDRKGLNHIVQDGVSSCDVGVNKRSGALFKYIHETYGIYPHEHVHIGDNPWSDVESPKQAGVEGVSYVPNQSHSARLERENLFTSRETLFQRIRELGSEALKERVHMMQATEAAAFSFGVEAAPLFIGFSLFIAEQAISQGLDSIYFFSREGEFFRRVFKQIFQKHALFGHRLPIHVDLEVSRLSTFAASMNDVSVDELSRIWRLYRSQKVDGLFTTLGLQCSSFTKLLNEVGLQPTDVIDCPEKNEALATLFRAPAFYAAVKSSIENQRGLLNEYLIEKDVAQNKKIGVVDIGWRGTIQDNLACVLPETSIHGMYLGLRRFINPQPSNVTKCAYVADESRDVDVGRLFEAFAVLEMLCSSNKGSVEKYERINGKVVPYRKSLAEEEYFYNEFIIHFQDGVVLAAEIWAPYLERYVVTSSELRELGIHVW
jgi:predicted HAD superfamily hydrolase